MSAECKKWAEQHSPYKGAGWSLHYALADIANADNHYELWVSQSSMAERARISRKTVNEYLQKFVDDGYLTLVKTSTGKGNANLYIFEMQSVTNCATKCNELHNQSVTNYSDDTSQSVTNRHTNQIVTKTTKEENQNKTKSDYTEDFLNAYGIYPRKVNKKLSFKCWNARLREGVSVEDLTKSAENYASHCRKSKTEEKYILHPSTFWGANERYLDYLPEEDHEEKTDLEDDSSFDALTFEEDDEGFGVEDLTDELKEIFK